MASLTETAYYSRKIIKWGAIGIVGFIILRLLFIALIVAINNAFPPPLLKPNNIFGKIPKIVFPENEYTSTESADLKFTLNTVSANIPSASEAAKVYFMPKNRPNLLSLSKAQDFVNQLDFTTSPRQISDNVYVWIDIKNPLRKIEMNIVNNHFEYNYAFNQDLVLFEEKNLPRPEYIAEEIRDFFRNINLEISDIDINNPHISYLKLVGDKLEITTTLSQANAIKIDMFKKPYMKINVLTDNPDEGNITFIISGSNSKNKKYLYIKYNYWPVNTDTVAIYTLKTSKEAWNELISGKYYIVKNIYTQKEIPITHIDLAYYDGKNSQLFMQPIFVFSSEDKFTAYIPAIAPPWSE